MKKLSLDYPIVGIFQKVSNTNTQNWSNALLSFYRGAEQALLNRVPFGKFNKAGREGYYYKGKCLVGLTPVK